MATSLTRRFAALLAWPALGVCLPAAAETTLHLFTEEYPPYNMSSKDGQAEGISTRIVAAMMKEARIDYSVKVVPWARAIALARVEADTCVFSMSRTPEREALYKWIGPLVYNDWTLFAPKKSTPPPSLDAVSSSRIGSYEGDAIVSYLETRGFHVEIAPNDDVNPKKLLAGHMDYWATGKLIGQYRLRQQKLEGQIVPTITFNRTEMYLACQKGMSDDLVNNLNSVLVDMVKAGRVRRIYADFGYAP